MKKSPPAANAAVDLTFSFPAIGIYPEERALYIICGYRQNITLADIMVHNHIDPIVSKTLGHLCQSVSV